MAVNLTIDDRGYEVAVTVKGTGTAAEWWALIRVVVVLVIVFAVLLPMLLRLPEVTRGSNNPAHTPVMTALLWVVFVVKASLWTKTLHALVVWLTSGESLTVSSNGLRLEGLPALRTRAELPLSEIKSLTLEPVEGRALAALAPGRLRIVATRSKYRFGRGLSDEEATTVLELIAKRYGGQMVLDPTG